MDVTGVAFSFSDDAEVRGTDHKTSLTTHRDLLSFACLEFSSLVFPDMEGEVGQGVLGSEIWFPLSDTLIEI